VVIDKQKDGGRQTPDDASRPDTRNLGEPVRNVNYVVAGSGPCIARSGLPGSFEEYGPEIAGFFKSENFGLTSLSNQDVEP